MALWGMDSAAWNLSLWLGEGGICCTVYFIMMGHEMGLVVEEPTYVSESPF
jgi:hypothetical protein